MKSTKTTEIKDPRAEYLKRIRSPIYVKRLKDLMESFCIFNYECRDNKISKRDLRETAKYLAEDIKNPM